MKNRRVWYLKVEDNASSYGIGEVAPIPGLSPEDIDEIPEKLNQLKTDLKSVVLPKNEEEVLALAKNLAGTSFPSVQFGLEVALLDLINGGKRHIFTRQPQSIDIPINGLVWMGDADYMKNQIRERLEQGFNCIKLKIGALDFDTEVSIIRELRRVSNDLIIRLDANGAFQVNEVLRKLKVLSSYNIHSIEQPILPMQPESMEIVCKNSRIPVALDEELIGIFNEKDRIELLQGLHPHYVVLKPSLHGGFRSVKSWIDLAETQGIGWWITSYLESNMGLNAIAQFVSRYKSNTLHHGLGTGTLYSNNIMAPLRVERGQFKYAQGVAWDDIAF